MLERAYIDLDLVSGTLLDAIGSPSDASDAHPWSELGDWLLLAARVNADRVFFVNDDPVLVFASLPPGADENEIIDLYRRTWSLARPRCLFLAIGDELRVYPLTRPPTTPESGNEQQLTPIALVTRAADVGDQLARFHRQRLESGAAFEDPEFAEQSGRADQQLLRDVRGATAALVAAGLSPRMAHALIERAILVRYLEDRGVLTSDYFDTLASRFRQRTRDIETQDITPDFGSPSRFVRFLGDRQLTYALFEQLATDFNGDLFVAEADEEHGVLEEHLQVLKGLLQGRPISQQPPLFLWAYDFSVIPTSLVSTMYELFYREEADGPTSTYYTPPELVEFVLANVLDADVLDGEPRICDPACGSGIFLVEGFRRMVRHEAARAGRALSSARLKELLLTRIAGCDIDEAAIRLAAFSLYVAFLNYQSPQDILSAGPLPRLIDRIGLGADRAPLLVGDAFSRLSDEPGSAPVADSSMDPRLPWRMHEFDVVVGNPPWTEPTGGARSLAERWALERHLPVGDRSQSQLFLWRALDLLSQSGIAALLVSAKAIFNARSTSKAFRVQWLQSSRVDHVVNFSQVRRDFFAQGTAPFMLIRFRRGDSAASTMLIYETALPVAPGRRGSAALARLERRVVSQEALRRRDYLWKTYSAGSVRDAAFLARLELDDRLRDRLRPEPRPQYGFQRARPQEGRPPSPSLRDLRSLSGFESWGPLREEWFESVPPYVKRQPDERIYTGQRLLVRRGVSPGFGPHARLESEPFAFRHTIFAIPVDHLPAWQAKVILGTLLSSIGRYWLYMVSGSWGTWRDEVRSEDVLDLPIRIGSASDTSTTKIVTAVDSLRRLRAPASGRLWDAAADSTQSWARWEQEIDDGVAELFELSDSERDLITDFWEGQRRTSTRPMLEYPQASGTARDLASSESGLGRYLATFLNAWNSHLDNSGQLSWQVYRDPQVGVIAVVFEPRPLNGYDSVLPSSEAQGGWSAVLARFGIQLRRRQTQSILRYGMLRAVSDTAIVIAKRDERRLWTATAAREDADATTAQAMALERR